MQDRWNAFHIWAPGRSEHLLWLVGRKNTKEDIHKFHSLIKLEKQSVMTFHFLACGENKKTLNFSFRTDKLTVSMIITETAEAIYSSLWGKYLNLPCASQAWVEISKNFENIWNFPHWLYGKHIRIQCPRLSRSLYCNYKRFFFWWYAMQSTVLHFLT